MKHDLTFLNNYIKICFLFYILYLPIVNKKLLVISFWQTNHWASVFSNGKSEKRVSAQLGQNRYFGEFLFCAVLSQMCIFLLIDKHMQMDMCTYIHMHVHVQAHTLNRLGLVWWLRKFGLQSRGPRFNHMLIVSHLLPQP